jgi:hypothetical protein
MGGRREEVVEYLIRGLDHVTLRGSSCSHTYQPESLTTRRRVLGCQPHLGVLVAKGVSYLGNLIGVGVSKQSQ